MFWKEAWTIVNTIQDLENVLSYSSNQKGGLKEWEKEAVLLVFKKNNLLFADLNFAYFN